MKSVFKALGCTSGSQAGAPEPQPTVPGAHKLQIIVPAGASPGQTIHAQAPTGETVRVQVPPGAQPGCTFEVAYTPAALNNVQQDGPMSKGLGMVQKVATNFSDLTVQQTGKDPKQWYHEVKQGVGKVAADGWAATADMRAKVSSELEAALASHDSNSISRVLDSALAAGIIGKAAPESVRKVANDTAIRQLRQALESDDPKRIKGAMIAAKRLNATEIPEFQLAVKRYHELKHFPDNWDVRNMVLGREGDKFVSKRDIEDVRSLQKFQALLDATHIKVYTRDRRGTQVPDKLQIMSVTEIANGELWVDYMARQESIRRELAANPDGYFPILVSTAPSGQTDLELSGPPLDIAVNEVLLFHGTKPLAADRIATQDFKINLSGSNAGTLYGRGLYFAENASKSDEYAPPDPSTGLHTLLLCRVTLGRSTYSDELQPDPRAIEATCLSGKNHSVLGDRKKCRGTFREFIIFDEEQVYTSHIITYRRVYT